MFSIEVTSIHYVDIITEFMVCSSIQNISIRSVPCYCKTEELQRLVAYFEDHLLHLEEESDIFMPLEAGFQLRAQIGERNSDGTGYISLLILLNVGFNSIGNRLYCGGEVIITLEEVNVFLQELQALISVFQKTQSNMLNME